MNTLEANVTFEDFFYDQEQIDEGLKKAIATMLLGAMLGAGAMGLAKGKSQTSVPDSDAGEKTVQVSKADIHPALSFIFSQTGYTPPNVKSMSNDVEAMKVGQVHGSGNDQMKFAMTKFQKTGNPRVDQANASAAMAKVKSEMSKLGAKRGYSISTAGDFAVAVWMPQFEKTASDLSRAMK